MKAFLIYVSAGRAQAITATAVFAVLPLFFLVVLPQLSLLLIPVTYMSGAVVGLTTLRRGGKEGLLVMGGAAALTALFLILTIGRPTPVVGFVLTLWAPVCILAVVLRATASQGYALAAAGALGVLALLGLHLAGNPVAALWDALAQWLAASDTGPQAQEHAEKLRHFTPVAAGLVVTAQMANSMLSLLLARWSHSFLDNPGGFGKEFRALQLGRQVALIAIVLVAASMLLQSEGSGFSRELVCIFIMLYLFQGFALVHALVAARGASNTWLVASYCGLLFLPLAVLLALLGYFDTWLDFRSRWRSAE